MVQRRQEGRQDVIQSAIKLHRLCATASEPYKMSQHLENASDANGVLLEKVELYEAWERECWLIEAVHKIFLCSMVFFLVAAGNVDDYPGLKTLDIKIL